MAKKLEVTVIGNGRSAERMFNSLGKSASGFSGKLTRSFANVAKGAAILGGAAALGGLAVTLKAGTEEFMEQAKVAAQTEAALKSTAGAANVTKAQIEALADAQMRKTGVDDELIQSASNLILTFKNVRNEVGAGNKIFDRATVASLDLSRAGFGSVESASKMLGKALNDPVKGMTAMSRAGVTFSDSQKKLIKELVKSGKELEAQKVILKEVESQVGGSAAAYGRTLPGQLSILKQSFSNLAGELVSGLVPSLSAATSKAAKFVSEFSAAKGWRARLNIIWDGVQAAGQTITDRIGDAVAMVDWAAAWVRAKGIGEGLAARFRAIDWTSVGTSIGNGIASAITTAAGPGKALAGAAANLARSIDWVALGRAMGPGLAAALVTAFVTLLDPAFWAKNWDLALALALAVFGRGIGKLVAPLGRMIATTVGGAFSSGILAIVGAIERLSPRLASAVMSGLLKLPGLVTGLLGRLSGLVGAGFGKLNALARFVVKVLGIQAAINAVAAFAGKVKEWIERIVGWFKDLPGRIRGAFPNPGGILAGIGSSIISGLWSGLKSKWGDVAGWLGGLGGQIKGLKGPISEDRKLLTAEGAAIIRGLGDGMAGEWSRVASFLRSLSAQSVREINALQAKIDAINARREAQDRAAAVRQAEAALVEARKKKEGVAAAEQALARAREDIVVSGLSRQLAKEQALYDRRNAMVQVRMDKLNAIVQRTQEKAAAAFDRMQSKIMRAFDASRGGMMTPAEAALAALDDSRRNRDLQKALADAFASGDQDAILRAQEDIQRASLERQAAEERRALDQQTEAMREKLEDKLAAMATAWKGGTDSIVSLLEGYGIDFANVGALLGDAFRESLLAAMRGSSNAAAALGKAKGNVAAATKPLQVPKLASGGHILSNGLAFVHRGETVVPAGAGLRGGGVTFSPTINVSGVVGDKRAVALAVRDELVAFAKDNGPIFGGHA